MVVCEIKLSRGWYRNVSYTLKSHLTVLPEELSVFSESSLVMGRLEGSCNRGLATAPSPSSEEDSSFLLLSCFDWASFFRCFLVVLGISSLLYSSDKDMGGSLLWGRALLHIFKSGAKTHMFTKIHNQQFKAHTSLIHWWVYTLWLRTNH